MCESPTDVTFHGGKVTTKLSISPPRSCPADDLTLHGTRVTVSPSSKSKAQSPTALLLSSRAWVEGDLENQTMGRSMKQVCKITAVLLAVSLLVAAVRVYRSASLNAPRPGRLFQQRHPTDDGLNVEFVVHHDFNIKEQTEKKDAQPQARARVHRQVSTFTQCSIAPNEITKHIRLLNITMHDISMTPPDQVPDVEQRYFNPAIIPLPPWSPHPYLLVSRLVTSGLHQEAHACFADFCLPRSHLSHQRHGPDTTECSTSDLAVLGPRGGLRCATNVRRVNVPPTPAYRCVGSWSSFPDIPGFHDPRVFWSGGGEPLIMVNSGSQYGCVGLWLVDLRAVDPEMAALMRRDSRHKAKSSRADDGAADVGADRGDHWLRTLLASLEPKISYPFLTEITTNPAESRSDVEKNWILFFPQGEEAWVQYSIVDRQAHLRPEADEIGHDVRDRGNQLMALDTKNVSMKIIAEHNHKPPVNGSPSYSQSPMHTARLSSSANDPAQIIKREERSEPDDRRSTVHSSRSIAKLIGHGFTTPPLTNLLEPSCLSTNGPHSEGAQGHWHQGSNSLRLVLCQRTDSSCHSLVSHEEQLVETGMVVHFAILHRKFSNELDLPQRYERYVMVWEARHPFRMIGVSRHPILLGLERARPWTVEMDGLGGMSISGYQNATKAEQKKWEDVLFTYTPSIAWSWRRSSQPGAGGLNPLKDLGTGYLDDMIVIGIGVDDVSQAMVKVAVQDLLGCLRLCPDIETTIDRSSSG